MTDLTNAVEFEIESLSENLRAETTINRWTKKGDRLYINDLRGFDGGYIDLETGELHEVTTYLTGSVEIDGDTITVTYTGQGGYEVVISVDFGDVEGEGGEGDDDDTQDDESDAGHVCPDCGMACGSEGAVETHRREARRFGDEQHTESDEDDTEDEPELVADGGRDIEQATADIQAELGESVSDLGEYHEVVGETGTVVVYADHDGHELNEVMDDLNVRDEYLRDGVRQAMHDAAREVTDHDWAVSDPLVVPKPDGMEVGERHVEEIVTRLMREGLAPGQAWAYYGVVLRGNSRNQWAKRCGYSDHSAVSEAVRKAKQKLP